MEPAFPVHTRPERVADAVIHGLGLALAAVATVVLLGTALPSGDGPRLAGLGIYAAGLLAMLACSALYNLTSQAARKALYQRFDHAAIFAMIAGSYTPFALVPIGGAWGLGLLAFVWTVAAAGILVSVLDLRRPEALLTGAYLLLGWSILVAIRPLVAAVSTTGLALLVAGGVLYSVGTVFHHWRSLPFQNPIWHGFVVAAAACHYVAILREVAIA
jgi:hemolysin III